MSDPKLTDAQRRVALELLERSALNDHPNPDRIGCPGSDFLRTLAFDRHAIDLGDSRINHLGHCSPCFREFVEFRRAAKSRNMSRRVAVGSIAATVLAGVGIWSYQRKHIDEPAQNDEDLVKLDLSNQSDTRGDDEEKSAAPSVRNLPRKRLVLRITLPFGSPAGAYEVQLLHADGRATGITTSGRALIENGRTLLSVKADTRTLTPDRYQIGIRRVPFDWVPVPIEVK